jgi:hypothetical protein
MTYTQAYRRMLNKMGYYNYHNALLDRHLNQEGGWDSHLDSCRSFILKALDYHKPGEVTVLGSGWLLELPVAEMVEKNIKVRLVDIIHPPEVINQAGGLKNIELISDDLTGGLIEKVWLEKGKHNFFNKLKSLENIFIPEYKPAYDPGMIISLNLLTQLEYLLIQFLKTVSGIKEEEFALFRSEIQKKHIDFLKKHNSVLISDVTEITTNNSRLVSEIPTLMTELPKALFREEWSWNFGKAGSDYYNSRSELKVYALTF